LLLFCTFASAVNKPKRIKLGVFGDTIPSTERRKKLIFGGEIFCKEWELDDYGYIRATNDGFKAKCRCRGIEVQIANLIK